VKTTHCQGIEDKQRKWNCCAGN